MLVIFFNDTATTEIYTLSLHDALPICQGRTGGHLPGGGEPGRRSPRSGRSEEHTSELQSRQHLVCRLLLAQTQHISTSSTIISQPTTTTLFSPCYTHS